jgi:Protein of unknown function (DUF3499)
MVGYSEEARWGDPEGHFGVHFCSGPLANHIAVIHDGPMRGCTKLGCGEEAVATAALRYRERTLWIGDLAPIRDPNLFDLCGPHAIRLTAPYGWSRIDDRTLPAATTGA